MMKRLVRPKFRWLLGMIRRAVRHGIRASYVVADAWFGNKDMMRAAKVSLAMTAILRMKRGKTAVSCGSTVTEYETTRCQRAL